MKQSNILFFSVNEPYGLCHKNDVATLPVGAHTHNVTEIYLTLNDLPDVLLNDTVSSVKKGSLVIIPPFCVHQLYHENGVAYERYIMNINTEWLDNVLWDKNISTEYLKNANKPLIISLDDGKLCELTRNMKQYLSEQIEPGNCIRRTARFFDLFDRVNSYVCSVRENNLYEQPVVTCAQQKVNEIIAYINKNLMTGITVEQIAEHFYLNKDYISRLFSKHTHTTIGRYVSLQRISKAQELLREGHTVTEVQEMMGYSSYAHFFKTFTKLTGISPSKYRK